MNDTVMPPIDAKDLLIRMKDEIDRTAISPEALKFYAERYREEKEKVDRLAAETHQRQDKLRLINDLICAINNLTDNNNALDLSKNPALQEQLRVAKELGANINADKLTFNPIERDRLIQNLQLKTDEWDKDNRTQTQKMEILVKDLRPDHHHDQSKSKKRRQGKTSGSTSDQRRLKMSAETVSPTKRQFLEWACQVAEGKNPYSNLPEEKIAEMYALAYFLYGQQHYLDASHFFGSSGRTPIRGKILEGPWSLPADAQGIWRRAQLLCLCPDVKWRANRSLPLFAYCRLLYRPSRGEERVQCPRSCAPARRKNKRQTCITTRQVNARSVVQIILIGNHYGRQSNRSCSAQRDRNASF